jgi:hypothetical protein
LFSEAQLPVVSQIDNLNKIAFFNRITPEQLIAGVRWRMK